MNEQDLVLRLNDVENRSKSNTHRIDRMEQRQDEADKLIVSVQLLAQRMGTVETDVGEIKGTVKALAEKPGKRWDGLVEKLIWLLVGGLITFAATHMGLPL